MRVLLIPLVIMAVGCETVERVRGPDGELIWQVTCYDQGFAPCMNEAAEVCGKYGYEILDKKSEGGVAAIASSGSLIVAGTTTDRMLFRCGDEEDDDDVAH